MKKLLLISIAFMALVGVYTALMPATSYAQESQDDLIKDGQCQGGDNTKCVADCFDPASPQAQQNPDSACGTVTPCPVNQGADCNIINKYVNPAIQIFSIMGGIAVVIGIIYGGIQYSTSGGDPQKTTTAKRHIRNALIALMLYFFMYALLKFLIPGNLVTD